MIVCKYTQILLKLLKLLKYLSVSELLVQDNGNRENLSNNIFF